METVLRVWLTRDPLVAEPANDDWVVLGPGHTPAGALQIARVTKRRLLRQAAREPGLLWDSGWRCSWHNTLAFERCVIWRFFLQRWPWG